MRFFLGAKSQSSTRHTWEFEKLDTIIEFIFCCSRTQHTQVTCSSIARGATAPLPPLARRKEKKEKNVLSAHLRGLFAAIEVFSDF